ncbi:MAG TPA: metallophosphoesterase [Candidatus Nanoarchaeia archaeon]|nr:metallophosphoesterase [Candidatus Nanoarchaeia archaeon]
MNTPTVALDKHSFLIASDAHATPETLARLLDLLQDKVQYLTFLGDAVGYGTDPIPTMDMIDRFDVAIRGNHDTLALGINDSPFSLHARRTALRHREEIGEEGLAKLARYVPTYRRGNMILYHGTPTNENAYLLNAGDISVMLSYNPEIDLFFGGHLHIPRVAVINKKTGIIDFEEISVPVSRHDLDLERNKYVINAPSTMEGRYKIRNPGACVLYHQSETEKTLIFQFL